ncbi:AMP-binding protein [Nonomuraea wenchangensis]|uniref:AMP-binding protein n=1 Tax=Nonomuraea wenchangensis TaxID=568860 RepID=UPI003438A835
MSRPYPTLAAVLASRAGDERPALLRADGHWTWGEVTREAGRRASWMRRTVPPQEGRDARHVGLLMDNDPEYVFWLGAVAMAGDVAVALNTTRSPEQLAADIAHTDVDVVIASERHVANLPASGATAAVFSTGAAPWREHDAVFLEPAPAGDDLFVMLFTSGSTGRPKAVLHSHGRLLARGRRLMDEVDIDESSTVYLPMPLFHAGTLIGLLLPAVLAGARIALRPKFSGSRFAEDVRRFGATHTTFVGKTLKYVLESAPEPPEGSPLRVAVGNGASQQDIDEFARRFGCRVIDVYGSTEGAISLRRTPDTPPGSLGLPQSGDVRVLDPATGRELPRVPADASMSSIMEGVGDMVRVDGTGHFEGYWRNDEAQAERVRDGCYWSGDLAWRDEQGFFYFAGRAGEKVRVDGENLSPHRVQEQVERHPRVRDCLAFGVPEPGADDALMVVVTLTGTGEFDPDQVFESLNEQGLLSRKEIPRFLRVTDAIPSTATNKPLTGVVRGERWGTDDPVWWRPTGRDTFRLMKKEDKEMIDLRLAAERRVL